MRYTRVLVPLDGSDGALAALGPARRLARLHRAELGVVTVAEPDTPAAEAEAIVNAGRRAAGEPGVRAMILRATDVPAELARLDRDHPEFLLCLATSARRPLGRAVLGSVAREVVRHSDQAVVLVGPRCDVANTNDIRRLLVCLDGTAQGEAILPWAKRWSTATGVPLVLVRVVYPLMDPAARIPPTESQLEELEYASRLARELEQDGYRVADVVVQHPPHSRRNHGPGDGQPPCAPGRVDGQCRSAVRSTGRQHLRPRGSHQLCSRRRCTASSGLIVTGERP